MTITDLTAIVKKHPIGVSCGLVSLLCGVWLYLRSDAIDERKDAADQKAKESQVILENVRNSDHLAQHTEAIQQAAKQLESRLVKAGQLATNLQYFYRLESDTGVKLTDVRQNQNGRGTGGAYIGVPYTVTIQGNFKQVLAFIERIESGRHFSKFDTIAFNKAAGGDETTDLLSVHMSIELLGAP